MTASSAFHGFCMRDLTRERGHVLSFRTSQTLYYNNIAIRGTYGALLGINSVSFRFFNLRTSVTYIGSHKMLLKLSL